MPVVELQARMSVDELIYWQAFFTIEAEEAEERERRRKHETSDD